MYVTLFLGGLYLAVSLVLLPSAWLTKDGIARGFVLSFFIAAAIFAVTMVETSVMRRGMACVEAGGIAEGLFFENCWRSDGTRLFVEGK